MRVFAIHDNDLEENNSIGYLFFYERSNTFIIELADFLDEWTAPVLFSNMVKNKEFTVPREHAHLWVNERVIPPGRQNIAMILNNAKLSTYNEGKLLALSNGYCSQDACYLEEIDANALPEWVVKRQQDNILEAFPYADNRVICILGNDTVIEVDLRKCIAKVPKIEAILDNKRILASLKVDAGGYGITFNDSISIQKSILIENGIILPVYSSVFLDFAKHCIVNTAEACTLLNCSRQNLGYLVKNEMLHPIKDKWKENVFLKGDITSMD
jgi:hypothetical protein